VSRLFDVLRRGASEDDCTPQRSDAQGLRRVVPGNWLLSNGASVTYSEPFQHGLESRIDLKGREIGIGSEHDSVTIAVAKPPAGRSVNALSACEPE
jgi:hypothetical protein